jgi:hypothetical protein
MHDYKLFKENSTVYKCHVCGQFKMGEAIDDDGLEMFVFRDGSVIKMGPKL